MINVRSSPGHTLQVFIYGHDGENDNDNDEDDDDDDLEDGSPGHTLHK